MTYEEKKQKINKIQSELFCVMLDLDDSELNDLENMCDEMNATMKQYYRKAISQMADGIIKRFGRDEK